MKKEDCTIGMRVRAIAPCYGLKSLVGKHGTIRKIVGGSTGIGVEFDEPFDGGHTLGGVLPGDNARGRWCESESLEPFEGMHIIIDSDGIKTSIHAVINERVIDKTVRVAKEDTPNAYVGALMALNKAFGVHLGLAKNGDNVLVVNPIAPYNDYSIGDIVRMVTDTDGTNTKNDKPVVLFAAEYTIIDDNSILAKPGKPRKVVCSAVDKNNSPFVVGDLYVVDPDNTISVAGRKAYVHETGNGRLAEGKNCFVVINEDGKDAD